MESIGEPAFFQTAVDGVTGMLKFDTDGRRTEFQVQIHTLTSHGLEAIGTWSLNDGISMTKLIHATLSGVDNDSLFNQTFIVLTTIVRQAIVFRMKQAMSSIQILPQNPPYGMLKDSAQELVGNSRFEGFGIDIIHELSLMLGFNYEFRLQKDGKYGAIDNVTKEWNGMIREIRDGRAHLAITDLTMTR